MLKPLSQRTLTYNSVQSGASVSVQVHILVFSGWVTYNSVQSGASVSVQVHILVFSGWVTYNSVQSGASVSVQVHILGGQLITVYSQELVLFSGWCTVRS